MSVTGLLLAAGGSRRFHGQKLAAALHGVPVVRHAADALRSAVDAMVVIVGHEASLVAHALDGVDATIVENPEWERGLSSTIARGVEAVAPDCEAVVIAVGDQPGIDPSVVAAVVGRWRESGKAIVSASYRGVRAHPVLFDRTMFAALLSLEGDAGARLLIERAGPAVAYVEVDGDVPMDVDTREALRLLETFSDGPGSAP